MYWFNPDGHVETGWARIGGKLYHFAPDGKMDMG
jgi:Putative cell wall binding repeat.